MSTLGQRGQLEELVAAYERLLCAELATAVRYQAWQRQKSEASNARLVFEAARSRWEEEIDTAAALDLLPIFDVTNPTGRQPPGDDRSSWLEGIRAQRLAPFTFGGS